MTKGKIVLVPFPFDDLTAEKVRPALCLTDPIGPHRHLIMAFISSQMPTSVSATDIVLDSRQKDFRIARSLGSSVASAGHVDERLDPAGVGPVVPAFAA